MTPTAPVAGQVPGLGPAQRSEALRRLREETFDVLVVGGGVTGCGAALDAASRGLNVALVEAHDLASGTSSGSSKLIHGGLRYLEQRRFALVAEALRERSLLVERLCPHLVRPVRFMLPLTGRVWQRAYVGAGLILYDTMAGHRNLPRHRHLTRREALRRFPSLRPDGLVGAIEYSDARMDDARHTMTVARTAAHLGAAVATGVAVTGLLRSGDDVVGAVVVDGEESARIEVRAARTIVAVGPWAGQFSRLLDRPADTAVRPSKGVHIVVRRARIDASTGLIARTNRSVLFVIPWGEDHWIIGTTDTPWAHGAGQPAATAADIGYILDEVNRHLVDPLRPSDIVGVYVGLRPLVAGEDESTTTLSREHAVRRLAPGVVAVTGGKYTTYRVMAADAVDAAVEGLEARPPSCTDRTPLLGADGYWALWNSRGALARRHNLAVGDVERLLYRYGSLLPDLLDLIGSDPRLGRRIDGAGAYLGVEAVYAASHEGALHLDDVLTRRLRVSIEEPDRGIRAAPAVAALVAPILGWDGESAAAEVEAYRRSIEAMLAGEGIDDEEQAAELVRRAVAPHIGA